jgi:glycosyltransferase involved in cell wall biosynthesis
LVSLLPSAANARTRASAAGIPVFDAPDQESLRRMIAAADIVQVHFWNNPEIHALIAEPLPASRILVWCHVNGENPPHVLPRFLFGFADVVAVTEATSLALPQFRDADPAAVAVVAGGADFSRLKDLRRTSHAGFEIGFIGRLDFAKLHPGYVDLCAAIRIPDARFSVCGSGAARAIVQRQAAVRGLNDRFALWGHVEDVAPFLARMDVFGYPLCPGNMTTCELAVQEAMYAGVPPVVLAYGGPARMISSGRNGVVAASTGEYVRAIEYLYRNPEERQHMSERAARDARAQFGAERCAEALDDVYRRLMQRPKRARPGHPCRGVDLHSPRGARLLLRSLDETGDVDFRASLSPAHAASAEDAEKRIACCSADMVNVILQYRMHAPDDPHLRLWSGLVLHQSGRPALAASEFQACRRLGFDSPHLKSYMESAIRDARGAAPCHVEAAVCA